MTLSVQLELALKPTNSYTTPLNIHRFVRFVRNLNCGFFTNQASRLCRHCCCSISLTLSVQRRKLCFPVKINYIFAAVSSQASQGTTGHTEDEPVKFFRTHFTAYQRRELEKTFSQSQYISPQKRQSLSVQLGISNEIIQVQVVSYLVDFNSPYALNDDAAPQFLNHGVRSIA